MNMFKRKNKLISKLKNKEYRDAFLAELITTGIPFQIKALREQRNLTQKQLGDQADMAQETISRFEDPNYGKLNLKTLERLASAFDVGLVVRFVPFSELVSWEINLSPESLGVLSFEQESYFQDMATNQAIFTREDNDVIDPENPIDSTDREMLQNFQEGSSTAVTIRVDKLSGVTNTLQAIAP